MRARAIARANLEPEFYPSPGKLPVSCDCNLFFIFEILSRQFAFRLLQHKKPRSNSGLFNLRQTENQKR
jgi:hypothetical protein